MQRKLTAILSADVVGNSGLMEADEIGTLERLKSNRGQIFDPQVARCGGRLFELLGGSGKRGAGFRPRHSKSIA